jgi:hypothetical protein
MVHKVEDAPPPRLLQIHLQVHSFGFPHPLCLDGAGLKL